MQEGARVVTVWLVLFMATVAGAAVASLGPGAAHALPMGEPTPRGPSSGVFGSPANPGEVAGARSTVPMSPALGSANVDPAPSLTPYVKDTLILFNNTLVPGNYRGTTGLGPSAVAYDSGKGEIFVGDVDCYPDHAYYACGNVSVISDVTDKVVATIPVVGPPQGIAYDSEKGEVFVATETGSTEPFTPGHVAIISDATNSVIATVTVGVLPFGVAYDSGTGQVFVSNSGSNNVSVISDVTNKVVASVP